MSAAFTPQHGSIEPMLLSEIPGYRSLIESQSHVFVQPKLAGWRGVANTRTRRLYTRSGRLITTLPHINAALPVNGPEWLDGELYVHGRSESEIQSMIKSGSSEVEFHVFDIVDAEPSKARFNYMYAKWQARINTCTLPVKLAETYDIMPSQINDFYWHFLNQGYEGLVIRLDGFGYEHGRSQTIFKMKPGTEVI